MKKAISLIIFVILCASCSGPVATAVIATPSVVQPDASELPPTETPPAPTALPPTSAPPPTTVPTPTAAPLPVISPENAAGVSSLAGMAFPSLRKVAFAPDGSLFATASGNQADFMLQLWESPSGAPLQALIGYTGIVWDLTFSPDGQWLATAADDTGGKHLRVWNMSVRRQHAALDGPSTGSSVAFSPDGTRLAVGGINGYPNGAILVYDTTTWTVAQELKAPGQNVTALVFAGSDQLLSGGTDGQIRVWSLATGSEEKRFTAGKQANRLALSPDGQLLASNFCTATDTTGCTRGGLALWRTSDWTLVQTFDDLAECLTFSPDGSLLVSGSGQHDPLVRIRSVADGSVLQTLPGEAFSVTFSPDGRLLVTTSFTQITLWGLPAE